MNTDFNKINTQARKYQITINNPLEKGYTSTELDKQINSLKGLIYACYSYEKAQTMHVHIFACFENPKKFSTIKKLFPESHIEACKGTCKDNRNYIFKEGKWEGTSKEETKIPNEQYEIGNLPNETAGKRMDMSELYLMVLEGKSNAQILAVNQDYILNIDKLDKLRTMLLTEHYKETVRLDLEVIYVYGATGAGKTRGALEENGYSNVCRITDYKNPFDGYTCQPVICFDEFRSSLKLSDMLLYCDIYPLQLPSRYNNKFACYNKIYIISNWELEKQYSELQKEDIESWKAFLRRINKVVYYKSTDEIITYESTEDYFNRKIQFEPINEQIELPFD